MASSAPQPARQPGSSSASTRERLAEVLAKKHYELMGELGRGGMGVVYLARDTRLGRKVALKTLSPERASRETSLRRFEREARTFASIRHPHIATLYEFEDAGPMQYLALEYIDGYDLESERRRGRIWEAEEAARVIFAVADALDYTHKKGILHRDIKPGNILIEAGTERVVLTDFGLAKGSSDETLTAVGFAVGTPAYMAPEQITDQFGIKPNGRADLFSLGTVFYEMLTGEHPFIGADDLKTMRNVVSSEPLPIRDFNPDVAESLERIIFGMLKKHPNERTPNARVVADQLAKWLEEKSGTAPVSAKPNEVAIPVVSVSGSPSPMPRPTRSPSPAPPARTAPRSPTPHDQESTVEDAPRTSEKRSSVWTTIVVAALVGFAMLFVGMLITLWWINRG